MQQIVAIAKKGLTLNCIYVSNRLLIGNEVLVFRFFSYIITEFKNES